MVPPTASISSRHPLSIIIFLSRRRLVTVDVTAAKTDYIEHTVYCKEWRGGSSSGVQLTLFVTKINLGHSFFLAHYTLLTRRQRGKT